MDILSKLLDVLVIICLLGTMIYATNALKARKSGKMDEKQKNITTAGIFFAAYCMLTVIRLVVESKLG